MDSKEHSAVDSMLLEPLKGCALSPALVTKLTTFGVEYKAVKKTVAIAWAAYRVLQLKEHELARTKLFGRTPDDIGVSLKLLAAMDTVLEKLIEYEYFVKAMNAHICTAWMLSDNKLERDFFYTAKSLVWGEVAVYKAYMRLVSNECDKYFAQQQGPRHL
jgi:hypothetical protein